MKASDPKRGWIALGAESATTVIAACFFGWWLGRRLDSPAPLVVGSLAGVGIAFCRLLSASR